MSTTVEMKGAGFHSMIAAVGELDGDDARARVIEAMPAPIGPAFRSGALTRVGWYPIAQYDLLHQAIQTTVGGGERKAHELGRKSTEIDTRGLLRYMLAITTPGLLVRHAGRVFGSYIRGADVRAHRSPDGSYDVDFHHVKDVSRFILSEWEGGIGYLLEIAGATGVTVRRTTPLATEDGRLTMVARWDGQ